MNVTHGRLSSSFDSLDPDSVAATVLRQQRATSVSAFLFVNYRLNECMYEVFGAMLRVDSIIFNYIDMQRVEHWGHSHCEVLNSTTNQDLSSILV